MLLVAVVEGRTLSGVEERELQAHIASCAVCQVLELERKAEEVLPGSDDRLCWVARIPADALDDPDLLVLPTVNPIVFQIDAELGQGGMGRILRARDRRLGREVAITVELTCRSSSVPASSTTPSPFPGGTTCLSA